MRVETFRLVGIRCFEDTGEIKLSAGCNIFVGQNNAGKSTLLQGVSNWQIGYRFSERDNRPGANESWYNIELSDVDPKNSSIGLSRYTQIICHTRGNYGGPPGVYQYQFSPGNTPQVLNAIWPENPIVPFLAKRKAVSFAEDVSRRTQSSFQGTFDYLYARIDRVSDPGPSYHIKYKNNIEDITGTFITTNSSTNGKEGGYFYDDDNFITLDRMGDGISEITALIV